VVAEARIRKPLSVERHDRDSAGLRYVYPVLSRRAGGVSVGINLNTNNACNWACVYCQVPGLVRGAPEPVDLAQMEAELRQLLDELQLHAASGTGQRSEGAGRIADLAFSGNDEPTAAPEFGRAVERVGRVLRELGLTVPLRVITNGSLLGQARVRQALQQLGELGGEVWFKVDRGSRAGTQAVNSAVRSPERTLADLRRCAALAPTWIQTCWFAGPQGAPEAAELDAYLQVVAGARDVVRGILLYGLARPSMQPGGESLRRLAAGEIEAVGAAIRRLGVPVTVSP
jgi:wyosine [tRNA(Phe)-imidazoG37] synthetase (radical SAM superfamily)